LAGLDSVGRRRGAKAKVGTRQAVDQNESPRNPCRRSTSPRSLGRSGIDASLLTYRHGLRAAEVCDLRWDQVDFNGAVLHVRRVKNGTPSTHPIQGDELRALRRLHRESPSSPFVFVSERGSPFTMWIMLRQIAASVWVTGQTSS
jgi:integrase